MCVNFGIGNTKVLYVVCGDYLTHLVFDLRR